MWRERPPRGQTVPSDGDGDLLPYAICAWFGVLLVLVLGS
jgi:hypothetical protein